MDFKEYMVKRRKGAKEIVLTILLYIAAVILAFVFMTMLPSASGGISALLAAGCFYGAYKVSARFNREFEYVITDDCVDIDVIYNATNRKRLISFNVKDIEIMASVKNNDYNAKLKGEFKETIDATTLSPHANVYFAVVEKNGRKLVKFEPPHAALETLRRFAPSKIIITD